MAESKKHFTFRIILNKECDPVGDLWQFLRSIRKNIVRLEKCWTKYGDHDINVLLFSGRIVKLLIFLTNPKPRRLSCSWLFGNFWGRVVKIKFFSNNPEQNRWPRIELFTIFYSESQKSFDSIILYKFNLSVTYFVENYSRRTIFLRKIHVRNTFPGYFQSNDFYDLEHKIVKISTQGQIFCPGFLETKCLLQLALKKLTKSQQ